MPTGFTGTNANVGFSGGNSLGLNELSILIGKGRNIKELDYNNITVNPLLFESPLLTTKNIAGSNIVSIEDGVFITSNEVINNYQKNLIPSSGIIIDDNNNISVDLNLTGWYNDYINNNIYTYSNIGIGIENPLANIHIKNDNASFIIDNNYNNFNFNYNHYNYFVFANYSSNNDEYIEQFKIHKNAKSNSIIINENNFIDINSNINIYGNSYLSSNIFINNSYITDWLIDNGLTTSNYVNEKIITKPDTILRGIGKEIKQLDYNNITSNKLNFLPPFSIDDSNNISIDLNVTGGWTKNNITSNIYSTGSKIGIGILNPMANLHIGTMQYSTDNLNDNNGSLIISRTSQISNRNFKFGYDTNFNFILGDVSITNNWTSRIVFNNNSTININNNIIINGSISLNTFNINYNTSTSNFILGPNLLFINNSGTIGIGTLPNSLYKLIIDGDTKINSNLDVININANNTSFSNLLCYNIIESKANIISPFLNITNLLSSRTLNNTGIITTNTLNSTTITNKNLITTTDINCTNNINGNTINLTSATITGSINAPLITTSNINSTFINSTTSINTNIINSTNITTTNINVKNNINCDNTINANYIRTIIFNASDNITTYILNATLANLANLSATNTITSLNINCTNTFTGTTITTNTLTANTINSPLITSTSTLTANTINAISLSTSGNITNSGTITGNTLIINNFTCFNNVGIGTAIARGTLHLTSRNRINSSLIFTNTNDISIKIGYNVDNFTIGTYNINNDIWNNQLVINSSAPANSININSLGNIGIGTANTNNNYKMIINGNINADNLYKNGEELSTLNYVNQQFITNLAPYLLITTANNNYYKNTEVNSLITSTASTIQNNIASSFQYENNIYSSENRLPAASTLKNETIDTNSGNYYSGVISGFKIVFQEEKLLDNNSIANILYELYSSSGDKNKSYLFTYTSINPINVINWAEYTYSASGLFDSVNKSYANPSFSNNFYNLPSKLLETEINTDFNRYITAIGGINNYRGEYLIFKVNQLFTLKRFRFYVRKLSENDNISYGPGTWLCYGSKNGIDWTYINIASNPSKRLTPIAYIYDNINNTNTTTAYYEKSFNDNNLEFNFIGFIFQSLVDYALAQYRTLSLTRIEIFGKFKINPVYISSNIFNNTIQNYAPLNLVNAKLDKNINFVYPLEFVNNSISLNSNFIFAGLSGGTDIEYILTNYISSYTNVWKSDINNPLNYYYNNGCIGIGTANVNISNIANLKLDINGIIKTKKIISDSFTGNGDELTNINYNNLINKPDLRNLYNWNNYTVNDITNCYSVFNGNIGIGQIYTSPLLYKLNVEGTIYSTANIIGINFIENGTNLINKYLTISSASLNYFSNIGGTISGSIGIGTSANSYKLNINGNLNSTTIFENGININDKYLSIVNANINYISKFTKGTINNDLFITGNLGIGTESLFNNNKLTIFGSIYSTSNIISSNFTENGINLINKYLTIFYASNNYFSNIGGIISNSVGIGTNPSSSHLLNVNGSIFSSNNIICTGDFIENGSNLTNKYLSISYASNNYLSNINPIITGNIICSGNITENGLLLENKYLSRDVSIINCNIGIGTNPSSSFKLNVNGSIFSSNNIICTGDFIENGSNLSNKYLSISYASNNYLSNVNPIITGNIICSGNITEKGLLLENKYLSRDVGIINCNIGIGTIPSSSYKLIVNGSIFSSNNIFCTGNFIENGSNLSNKYLSISYASNNYLSNVNPIITGNISCSGNIISSNNIICIGNITENGILLSNKYLSRDIGIINCNIGIGTNPSSFYKLNVNGSIYSSNNIVSSGDFIENGSNLSNKYLSISYASNNYLSNVNPIITGNISCSGNINSSGNITENGILLMNKYLSRDVGIINCNIGIGTNPSISYKLIANGSIYSSNSIIGSNIIGSNIIANNLNCDNIKEKGSNLSDIYLKISDFTNNDNNFNIDNPNIQKKIGLKFICSDEIILNDITYYKYNINITKYVNNKLDELNNNPYRIFNIKCFSTDAVFRTSQINKPPNILQYDIYMSHLLNLDPSSINACAIGFPSNYYLNKITAGDIFILKTNNYNYLSVLSKFPNTNISCIISDFLF